MKSIVVVTVLIALCNSANAVCSGINFTGGLRFGEGARDTIFNRSATELNIIQQQTLNVNYTFFGKHYRSVFVCENGVICFRNCTDICDRREELKNASVPVIVGVWEDIMLHNFSISYKERDEIHNCFNESKKQVMEYLQRGFQDLSGFEPTHIFLSTWYGFHDGRKFQIIIVTAGEYETYVLLIYNNMTEDDRMRIGFSAGSGNKYYPLSKSTRGSNIGVSDVYVFRIDENDIVDPGPVDCGDLPHPANGEVVYTSTSVDSVATYIFSADCNTTIRVCLENGSWSGEEPKCPIPGIQMDENGLIEVRYNGEWRSVCDDYWTDEDANVACRQLGFLGYGAVTKRKGEFERGAPVSYWLDDVKCKGDERTLFDCEHRGIGDHNCGQRERAGVECIDKCDVVIELDDGVIELTYRGERMSVCANHWTNEDTEVACRQLNLQCTNATVLPSKEETSGVKVWMDFVDCRGDEESLFECDYIIVNENDRPCRERARIMCIHRATKAH